MPDTTFHLSLAALPGTTGGSSLLFLIATILIAVAFDFTNGFHDTANAIATSVSTRAVSPRMAVLISAVLNLAGAVITVVFFQAKVSNTIAKIVAFKAGQIGRASGRERV